MHFDLAQGERRFELVGRLFVFGMGYAAGHLAALLEGRGWSVTGTTRDGRGGTLRFDDRER
ncbi:hypothetical protein QCF01_18360, partial [Staphylococcus aureus]|nr:hypothetical protein [Staphylococcus aureus]